MDAKNNGTKAPESPEKTNVSSVDYNKLGNVFTSVEGWSDWDGGTHEPDSTYIAVRSAVYSTEGGVTGWALKTILGYEINGEIVQDDTGKPEVINYADRICNRTKTWRVPKTHEQQSVRLFVKSVGQDTGGQPNVAAYPLSNEVSVSLTIPAKVKYTVTFNANGGENAPTAQTKWHNETLILSSQKPTRTDYVFMGWSKTKREPSSGNYAIDYAVGASFTENANTTLYAVWKPRPLVIKYDANGGTGAPADQAKEHGQNIKLHTTVPTRQGYTFQGWATSKSSNTVAYQAGATYTADADVTLYAVWQIITYTITYNANGGTGAPNTQTKEYGKTVAISATRPTRDGHVFQGWSTANDTTAEYQPGANYTANANATLYAVWKIITYTISYDANGGSGAPQDHAKTWGVAINLSATKPTRQGYTFQGWATSSSGAVQYQPNQSYTANANVTLYAIWKIITYTIAYNANGGYDAPTNQSKEYGKSVNITTAKPKKINSEFLGWSTTASGEVQYTGGSIYNANANLSLFAVWRRIPIMKSLNGYEIYDEAVRELALGVTTTGTGAAYKADVKAIDALTVGVNFTIVPHVTCTTLSPTLDVNGFGAKPIKQRLSSGLTNTIALASNDVFAKGKPVEVFYDGTSWVIDMQAPDATHLHGVVSVGSLPTVPVNKGGTGATTAFAALNNLGITWGTAEAPAKGTPNSIYIQIN